MANSFLTYANPDGSCPYCNAKQMPRKEVPIEKSTEPIVGWRIWEYKERYLRSVFKTEFSWPYRVPLTKDVCHDAGIHTVKTFNQALGLLSDYLGVHQRTVFGDSYYEEPKNASKVPILGSCYLWGEVKDHAKGYLAECAYPKELYMAENTDPLTIFQIEEDYGVPVHLRKELNREEWDKSNNIYDIYYQTVGVSSFFPIGASIGYKFAYSYARNAPFLPAPTVQPGAIVRVKGNPNGSV